MEMHTYARTQARTQAHTKMEANVNTSQLNNDSSPKTKYSVHHIVPDIMLHDKIHKSFMLLHITVCLKYMIANVL